MLPVGQPWFAARRFDFSPPLNRRSRAGSSHRPSEAHGNPVWIAQAVEDGANVDDCALLLVEQSAINQVMTGFNPKFDVHQSLP